MTNFMSFTVLDIGMRKRKRASFNHPLRYPCCSGKDRYDICRAQTDFRDYEAVRLSGVTNMFDVELVGMLSGLTRPQIIDIMENYPT